MANKLNVEEALPFLESLGIYDDIITGGRIVITPPGEEGQVTDEDSGDEYGGHPNNLNGKQLMAEANLQIDTVGITESDIWFSIERPEAAPVVEHGDGRENTLTNEKPGNG